MSLKDTDVRTPGDTAIAKKFNLSLARVRKLVDQGAEHEKEHNTNLEKAKEVARDHIGERPDYYRMLKKAEKTKVSVKEETITGDVRGLGNVTGDPAVGGVNSYVDTNALSYVDENGNKLEYVKKQHIDLHNNALGYKAFDPTKIGATRNFGLNEGKLNELGEYDNKGGTVDSEGLTDSPPRSLRRNTIKEGEKLDKAKKAAGKVVRGGLVAANIAGLGQVAGDAAEGLHKDPKRGVVAAASSLPGAAGWSATGLHYTVKGLDKVREHLKNKQSKSVKEDCWKGYEAIGVKKKNGKTVPNCVPVKEQGYGIVAKTERPLYERGKVPADMSYSTERGINEISAELVGKVSNARFWRKETPSKTLTRAINKKFIESGKKKEKDKEESKKVNEFWMPFLTPHHKHSARLSKQKSNTPDVIVDPGGVKGQTKYGQQFKEETKMETNQIINEAIENIVENNLAEMKENFVSALNEKAMEKLEERKKDIAANYFAQ